MYHFLMAFYILFFATGFMGGAALLLLNMRMRSRLVPRLLAFQLLFLVGMALIMAIYYLQNLPGGPEAPYNRLLLFLATGINTAVWSIVILLIREISPPKTRRKRLPAVAEILSALVILKSVGNMVMVLTSADGSGGISALTGTAAWNLGGHVLTGLAMAAFGLVARGPINPKEPPALRPLVRAYGLCALVFAPVGLIESVLQSSGVDWLAAASLDQLFYLAWNLVSMSAALKLLTPAEAGSSMLDSVPEERVKSLGLSAREVQMAIMIGRGLANKEIAEQLYISPATVRTHIYNLYQKTGARSRVELLNKLKA